MNEEREELMARTRAAREFVNRVASATEQDELELEAFMAIFHPKQAKDRSRMNELKRDLRRHR